MISRSAESCKVLLNSNSVFPRIVKDTQVRKYRYKARTKIYLKPLIKGTTFLGMKGHAAACRRKF